ncbi:MAG: phosphatidate cytidylyltransferase [Candidatus Margulisbacteria bacterium]|jgi:hypothetical protein|nr:phosphatidate cytidylyltransferase [Candidatus Margulisiibacteriota bacterium]
MVSGAGIAYYNTLEIISRSKQSCDLPGHGGILDRMDSFVLTVPVFVCTVITILSSRDAAL